MDLCTVTQGLGAAFTAILLDSAGNPYTVYDGTEALDGGVRAGRDQPALFAPTLAWLDATAGTIAVTIAGSDTATLDVGRYLLDIRLADGSADLLEGYLEVKWGEGTTATVLPAYGTFADMLDVAAWIEKLQRDTDLAGFARQRYKARTWFDSLIQRHYRGASGLTTDYHFVPGISFGGQYGQSVFFRDGRKSKELQDWLDANRLDVTQEVIDAVTYYAVALVCQRQVVPGKDNGYAALAAKYFGLAEAIAMDITAEIDSDGDGMNDTAVRLGSTDTLEG